MKKPGSDHAIDLLDDPAQISSFILDLLNPNHCMKSLMVLTCKEIIINHPKCCDDRSCEPVENCRSWMTNTLKSPIWIPTSV